MRVLFVSSGNSKEGISPIVKRQGESLKQEGIELQYFNIKGKGLFGYLRNVIRLKIMIKNLKPEIVHAHYSLSAFLATLACAKPIVVSLMGSDVKSSKGSKILINLLSRYRWDKAIVKSKDMRESLGVKKVEIIPNGVSTELFYSRNKVECQKLLGWDIEKKHILFAANPLRPVKNYSLAAKAFDLVKSDNTEFHTLIDVQPDQMPLWLNSADVVLLTSLWEGSPNVIKEAMACDRPIVASDVGDIRWLLGDLQGHYLTGWSVEDIAEKINLALNFSVNYIKTKGKERIFKLGLDSKSVANELIDLYQKCKNLS